MATTLILLELAIVIALIFIGARVGGIGLGIYGMLGVFILVYGFHLITVIFIYFYCQFISSVCFNKIICCK